MKHVMKKLLVVLLVIAVVEAPLGDLGLVLTGEEAVKEVQAAATPTDEALEHEDDQGYGTQQQPYTISNKAQLYRMYNLIKAGKRNVNATPYSHCYYKLTDDIVLNTGNASSDGKFVGNADPDVWAAIPEFRGSFDGDNHSISGLYLTEESKPESQSEVKLTGIGLFGEARDATIKNVSIKNSIIKLEGKDVYFNAVGFLLGQGSKENNPSLLGANGGANQISGCSVEEDCYIVADSMEFDPSNTGMSLYVGVNSGINDNEDYAYYNYQTSGGLGGLVGMFSGGSIEKCSNQSSVVCQNIRLVGGIAGYTEGADIIDCSNTGAIQGTQSVGGITGMANGTLSKVSGCINTGEVSGMKWTDEFCQEKLSASYQSSNNIMAGDYIGGICGKSDSWITGCTNGKDAKIKGTANVGGIAGNTLMEIDSSMNYGAIEAYRWSETWHSQVETNMGGDKIFVTGCNAGGIAGSVSAEAATVAGEQNNQLVNCGNTAIVSAEGDGSENATNAYFGGLLGRKYRHSVSSSEEDIVGCYTAGKPAVSDTVFSTQTDIKYKNSYYLVERDNGRGGKSLAQFTGGEVAYCLNAGWNEMEESAKAVWRQMLVSSGTHATETYPVSNGEQNLSYEVIRISFVDSDETDPEDYSFYTQYINKGGSVAFDSVFPQIEGKIYEFARKDGTIVSSKNEFSEDTVLTVKQHEKKAEDTPIPTFDVTEAPEESEVPGNTDTPAPEESEVPGDTDTPAPEESEIPGNTDIPSPQQPDIPTVSQSPQNSPAAPAVQSTQDSQTGITEVGGKQYNIDYEKGYAVLDKISGQSKSVKIPSTVVVNGKTYPVKKIEAKAFYKDKKIENVVIGNGVEEIGAATFQGCENLSKITFPSTVKTIGANAFSSCKKVKKIELPGGVQKIGSRAFYNCKGLTSLKIKANKQTVDAKKFSKGSSEDMTSLWENRELYKAAISTALNIGKEAMAKCVKLRSVIIQNQVRRIGNATFLSCKKLAKITVKSLHLQYVGDRALKGVSNCKINVPSVKIKPYKKLFKNKGQGKKVVVAKA